MFTIGRIEYAVRSGGQKLKFIFRVEVPEVVGEESNSFVDNLNVEHFDGGGFSIGGVIVAPYCNIIMIIMSIIFMVGGVLLTVIAYLDKPQPMKVKTENNLLFGVEERKLAGPLIISIGALMLHIGIFLSVISCRANSKKSQQTTKYDGMGSTFTEESFFSILPSEPHPPRLAHPSYIPQHSLDEKESSKTQDQETDVAVQVESVGSSRPPPPLLELDPSADNISLNSNKLLHQILKRFYIKLIFE